MLVRRGFSLIELVIVVLIIGVLAGIAVPRLSRGSEGASVNAFVNEINNFAKVIDLYQLQTGDRIADPATGVLPSELADYLHANSWRGATPLGGQWDIERDDSGVGLAVGVHYVEGEANAEALARADALLDDGNLDTGQFRMIAADRFYLVVQE